MKAAMKTIYIILSISLLIGMTACLFGFAVAMIGNKNMQPVQIFVGEGQHKSLPDYISITKKSIISDRVKILELQKELMNEIMDYRINHGDNTVGWNINVNFFDTG